MGSDNVLNFYLSPTGERFFLVPADHPLPAGDFLVCSPTEEEQRVDLAALAAFEVSKDAAREHLEAILRQGLAQAGDVFSSLLGLAGFAQPGADSGSKQTDLDAVARIIGINSDELRRNSRAAQQSLVELAEALKGVLEYAGSPDPATQAAARDCARFLRTRLSDRGVELDASFEQLPDLLGFLTSLNQEQAIHELVGKLCAFAEQIDQAPATLGKQIDDLIARLEQQFGSRVGVDKARTQERIYQEARSSAQAAIAASLQAHGITPLTTPNVEQPDDTGKK